MATSKFEWTDGTAQSLTTDLHVQDQVPDTFYSTYPERSLDGTVLEVITIGSGVNELDVTIEAERDDTGLRGFRSAAARGLEITYTPDTDAATTTYTVKAVAVGRVQLEGRGRQDMFSLSLRLARLDGGVLAPDL